MYQAGGRLSITVGGTRISPRGAATIDPAGLEHDVMANQDGTVSRSTKAKAVTCEVTFDRGQGLTIKWDSAFMLAFYDTTFLEQDTNILHTFTGASLIGAPKINTETGEVTGLSFACAAADYSVTTGS